MGDKRQFRKAGDFLLLGQTLYRLESVEGCGGSVVVYRASYEDALHQGSRHYVFIKELFPYHPKGNIYRNQSGEICCKEDGIDVMEQSRQNFYWGNQANLKLLEQAPERVSGNLNSYYAYGTYYSVLTMHGGECLETLMEEGRAFGTLRETAEVILKILEAIEVFHNSGILHLDISPDNILLLQMPIQYSGGVPRQHFMQALLIDYNSVWEIDGLQDKACCFSEKEGYTAPEISLRQRANIGKAADLYSVCAVWFRMLTGARLSDKEIIGNHLRKSLHQDLEIFQNQPATAVWKTVQIMVKGLHVLARKRYQSAEQMRQDIEELMQRIDGKGISHNALWECSRQAWEISRRENKCTCNGQNTLFRCKNGVQLEQENTQYLNRKICTLDGVEYEQNQYTDKLQNGGKFLLIGAGGMGKTSLIMRIWEPALQRYQPALPIVMYIPLIGYQQEKEETCYIRKYLLRHIGFQDQAENLESALYAAMQILEHQLDLPDGWKLILLLDGLNEAGEKKKFLLKEIAYLAKKPAVGMIVTDRYNCVKKYGLYTFQVLELLPLTKAEVLQVLEQEKINEQNSNYIKDADIELLRNPMMLFLYQKTLEISQKTGKLESGYEKCDTQESAKDWNLYKLIGGYLDSLYLQQQWVDTGNSISQLRSRYLIYYFLPEIAAEMKRRRKTLLNLNELYALAQKNYKMLASKEFAMAFPAFLGKSRQMLEGIQDVMEWLDYAVEEQLIRHLNLMRKSGERNYCLAHENFMEYLTRQATENRRKTAVYKRKIYSKKVCLLIAFLSALAAGGFYVRRAAAPITMSEQERYQFREVLYQIGRNIGTLGTQLQVQQQILEKAAKKEVLDGEEKALNTFWEWMKHKQQQVAQYDFERSKNKDALEKLEKTDAELPFRILEDLLDKTYEMDIFMEECLAHLAEELKKATLTYTDREELVTFYQQYLDIYTETTYREMVMVLVCLEEDMEGEMLDIIGQTAAFRGYIRRYPYEGKSTKVLEAELQSAKANLRECRNRMKTKNYQISLPEWQ